MCGMGGHGCNFEGKCRSMMGGHGWAYVVADGYGMGMGTNLKEMLGSTSYLRSLVVRATIVLSTRF